MRGKQLTSAESDAINSILDEEEKRFGMKSNFGPRLSNLDDQCRSIWPDWQPASKPAPSSRPTQSYRYSPRNDISDDIEPSYQSPQTNYESPPTRPTSYRPPENKAAPVNSPKSLYQPRSAQEDIAQNDVDTLKNDCDMLMSKIRNVTRTSASSSPTQAAQTPKYSPKYGNRPDYEYSEARDPITPTKAYEPKYATSSPYQPKSSPPSYRSPAQVERPDIRRPYEPDGFDFEASPKYSSRITRTSPDPMLYNNPIPQRQEHQYQPKQTTQPVFDHSEYKSDVHYDRVSPKINNESPRQLFPETLRLQQENSSLKAELLKTKKSLEVQKEENQKLLLSLEKSEQLRNQYKKKLQMIQSQQQGSV